MVLDCPVSTMRKPMILKVNITKDTSKISATDFYRHTSQLATIVDEVGAVIIFRRTQPCYVLMKISQESLPELCRELYRVENDTYS